MNGRLFGLKRGYQSALRFSWHVLKGSGLTPARYDMCHALKLQKYGMRQKNLAEVLGGTRATVSRMVRSLEKLRYVRREFDATDRRCKLVFLTDEGRARLDAAYNRIVRPGWVQFALAWVLGTMRPGDLFPPRYCPVEMAELDAYLWKIRRGFADTGSLSYPR